MFILSIIDNGCAARAKWKGAELSSTENTEGHAKLIWRRDQWHATSIIFDTPSYIEF